jgi:hypothetical protein
MGKRKPVKGNESYVIFLFPIWPVKVVKFSTMTRSGFAIYLLGAPRIERDGRPVELDTRKALALLAYLVVRGGIHQRDALAALLYPESDKTRARGALRRTLSTLHKGLGRGALEITRESVEIAASAGEWLDIAEFHRFLEGGKGHLHPPTEVCTACLAEEFVAYAREQGAQVMQVRCYEGENDLAYSPMITGLTFWTTRPDGQRLSTVSGSYLSDGALHESCHDLCRDRD